MSENVSTKPLDFLAKILGILLLILCFLFIYAPLPPSHLTLQAYDVVALSSIHRVVPSAASIVQFSFSAALGD